MTELREKVARLVEAALERHGVASFEGTLDDADAILDIPEIRDGLEMLQGWRDVLYGGNGFLRIVRVDPADVVSEPTSPDTPR